MTSLPDNISVKPLLKRLLIPLTIVLALLILLSLGGQIALHNRQLNISSQQLIQYTQRTLEILISKETDLLIALGQAISVDSEVNSLLKNQDRRQLMAHFLPEFKKLEESQTVTHFYFHNPQGINLLRLHQPERYGDAIDRWTLQMAQQTGEVTSGLEVGPLGDFSLRVVKPVFEGDVIDGYIELGKRIEVVLSNLENLESVAVAFLIDKDILQKEAWETSSFSEYNRSPWERYTHSVLSYASSPEIAGIMDLFQQHGKDDHDHFHPLEDIEHLQNFELAHQHQQMELFEITYENKPAVMASIPLADAAGKQSTNLFLIQDISAAVSIFQHWISVTTGVAFILFMVLTSFLFGFLKRADKAIASQQKHLIATTDLLKKAKTVTNEGIWEWNTETGETTFDERYYTMAGYDPDEFPSSYENWRNRLHPDDLVAAETAANAFVEGKASGYDTEFRFRCKDNSYIWIRARAKVFAYDKSGKSSHIVGTHTNVTDRKLAQESLAKSQARYRLLVENQSDLLVQVDKEGKFLFVSPSYCKLFGKTEDQLLGNTFMPLVHEEDKEITARAMKKLFRVPHSCYVEQRAKTEEGWRWLGWMDNAVLDDNGEIKSIIGVGRDITFRREAEIQRDQLLREVQELNTNLEIRVNQRTAELTAVNKELEAFSYSVSHDLRAPLRAIDGFSQALLEDYSEHLDDIGKDYLKRVRRSAQRMGQLIDDLLQLSRLNRQDVSRQQVDLAPMARKVIKQLQSAESARKVEFYADDVLSVAGDPRLLRVMLDNLIGNAWKFTAKQQHASIIFTKATDEPNVFLIKDNGVGFDMKHADKLFGAFQRLHSMSEFPGTGIGLATVQRILHRHGGKIWVEAEVNRGATFYFSLPSSAN